VAAGWAIGGRLHDVGIHRTARSKANLGQKEAKQEALSKTSAASTLAPRCVLSDTLRVSFVPDMGTTNPVFTFVSKNS
jgi:hypothetical protein